MGLRPHQETQTLYSSFQTSPETYIKHIEKCTIKRDLLTGRSLHAHLIINGLSRLTHFASKLIPMYTECGHLPVARQLFDKIPQSNYRRWIVLTGAFAKGGFYRSALDLLSEMRDQNVSPNNYVIPSVLKACGGLSELGTGKTIHGLILRWCYEFDPYVISALIDMYSRCRRLDNALRVFNALVDKDVVAVNAMVSGYVQGGLVKEALSLVEDMQRIGVKANVITWNTLISGFSQAGDDFMVDELFRLMKKSGVEPDVVSWTSIISGFVQNFRNDEAFVMFKKMLDSGYVPRPNTVSGLLPACANVANVRRGKEIHGYSLVMGIEEDVYVKSALVDMYAKCGYVSDASKLFNKMSRKNTVTWNAMIFAYANNGYCDEAIALFQRMEEGEREKPDHLTFTAALTACSHGGMTELGEKLFREMQEKYGIEPRLEHYACIVDVLGRAGRINDAYDLIRKMPVEPDLFVWGALLGACRQYGEIELAQVAAKELAELEPRSAGSGVLMSSLYHDAGSWGNAARLRKLMKKSKLNKFLGCSWIESG